jgi:hypothetical protein
MTNPKRWVDDGAPRNVEHLLRAAQAERPDEASLARSLSAVGVGLGVTSAAAGAKAAGTAASLGGTAKATLPITGAVLAKWTALVATVATVAFGAAEVATDLSSHRGQAPSASVRLPARTRPSPNSLPPSSSVLGAPVVAQRSPSEEAAPAAPNSEVPRETRAAAPASAAQPEAGPATPAASSGAVDADTLAEEVKSVDRARAALARGEAAQTLLVLDDYERRFRTRGFAPEALYLRMEAYSSLGRLAEARATAERLLGSYPNSLHGARARTLLSKEP